MANKQVLKQRRIDHMAKLIQKRVGYFNAWSVDDCQNAAHDCLDYIRRSVREELLAEAKDTRTKPPKDPASTLRRIRD